jgi:hypothetical protein
MTFIPYKKFGYLKCTQNIHHILKMYLKYTGGKKREHFKWILSMFWVYEIIHKTHLKYTIYLKHTFW